MQTRDNLPSTFNTYLEVRKRLKASPAKTLDTIHVFSMAVLIIAFLAKAKDFRFTIAEDWALVLLCTLPLMRKLFLERDTELADLPKQDQQLYFELVKQLLAIKNSELPAPEDKHTLQDAIGELTEDNRITKTLSLTSIISSLDSTHAVLVNIAGHVQPSYQPWDLEKSNRMAP